MLPELAETGGVVAAAAEANKELALEGVDAPPKIDGAPPTAVAAGWLMAVNEDSVADGCDILIELNIEGVPWDDDVPKVSPVPPKSEVPVGGALVVATAAAPKIDGPEADDTPPNSG